MTLTTIDWFILGGFLVFPFLVALWSARRASQGLGQYFLAGRDLPWWGVALSILATETSALTFIGVPAMAYGGNLGFMQIVLGYALGRVLLAAVVVPYYFKNEIYSPYALLGQAFGAWAQKAGAVFFLIAGTLAAGVRVFVTCIPLQLMLDWPVLPAILLFVGLSLIYTWAGGIRAVVWTDTVQFFLLVAGGLFALFYLPTLIDGGWPAALGQAREAGKLEWLNFDFALAKPFNFWMGMIGAVVFVLYTHGIDQLVAQRVLACRNVADGRKALLFCAVGIVPMILLFLMVGVLLWVHYQQTPIPIEPITSAAMQRPTTSLITCRPWVLPQVASASSTMAPMKKVPRLKLKSSDTTMMPIATNPPIISAPRMNEKSLRVTKPTTVSPPKVMAVRRPAVGITFGPAKWAAM